MSNRPTKDLPPLLTADQVSEQFESVGRDRLYQLARRGEIPAIRLGRAVRFTREAITVWLEAGGTASPAQEESES